MIGLECNKIVNRTCNYTDVVVTKDEDIPSESQRREINYVLREAIQTV